MGAITIDSSLSDADAAMLEAGTHTSSQTIDFSRILLVFFGLFVLFFTLLSLPWTIHRFSRIGWAGLRMSSIKLALPAPNTSREVHEAPLRLPRRIGQLPLPLPSYVIPRIGLNIPQAAIVVFAFAMIMVASFSNSNWITDSTRTGYVAITLVPCVVMLGNKFFGVGTLIQVGYASVNWAHRWLGRILFFITTIHVIAYTVLFIQTHSYREEMSKSSNVLASISYLGFCLIFFSSIGTIRRKWWHLFKVCHHIGIFLFVVGLNYHSTILRPWIGYTVAIIIFSVLGRIFTTRLHVAYITPLPSSKSTIIRIPSLRSGWIPGQHVRIRVLTGGMKVQTMWEAHPFTLAAAPGSDEGGMLVVKSAGDWTKDLFEVATAKTKSDVENQAGQESRYPVAVLVEGPYGGSNLVYSSYGSVLLVAGGSGVSYILGVAEGIILQSQAGLSCTKDLHLVWSVRDRAAVNDLLPCFERVRALAEKRAPQMQVTITLYFTSVSRNLVIRPFSIVPNHSMFLNSKSGIKPSPLGASVVNATRSTSALLAPGNSSVVTLGEDDEKRISYSDDGKVDDSFETDKSERRVSSVQVLQARRYIASSPEIELRPGRPDYAAIVQDVIEREQVRHRAMTDAQHPECNVAGVGRIAVGACGPSGIVGTLKNLCWDADGVEFHAEEFSL